MEVRNTLLIACVVTILAAAVSGVATPDPVPPPTPSCLYVNPPEGAKTVEFDPKPARYALPESNEPEPGYVLDEKGATITYTDVGVLEGHLCPGSDVDWYFTQTLPVMKPYPTCWAIEPVKISKCPEIAQ